MTTTATLTEFLPRELDLAAEAVARLQREHSKAFDLSKRSGGVWRVTPRHFVGTVSLPGLELRVRPKCGLHNLFHLLARAYRLADLRRELVTYGEVDDVRELLVEILIRRAEELVRLGLRSEYVEQRDKLPALRGRLDLDELLRRPPHGTLHLPCRFEEFTADIPHNQVLRYTLTRIGSAGDAVLESRRRRLLRALGGIAWRPFEPREIDGFLYSRLNAHYEPLHQLCRLLLEASGVEQDAGAVRMSSFLIDMNAVFEVFVASWLAEHLPPRLRLVSQRTKSLDLTRKIGIRPDLVVQHGGHDVLVADTKYKLRRSTTPSSADAFQALAYCRALGLPACVLIYPGEHVAAEATFPLFGGERVLTHFVPLSGTVEQIERGMRDLLVRCESLCDDVRGEQRSARATTSAP